MLLCIQDVIILIGVSGKLGLKVLRKRFHINRGSVLLTMFAGLLGFVQISKETVEQMVSR
jgi:TctA family transporter